MEFAFDIQKYKLLQKEAIINRISHFGKLYMEVGGKLFDDNHASRVLPGFEPNVKMQIFKELSDTLEVLFCVNTNDIISKKTRADNNLTYADETIRLVDMMHQNNISVLGIVITFYKEDKLVFEFEEKCKKLGIKTYKSYFIENYPNDLNLILSKDGFGKNDYIETTKNLILISAPGACSGKMETCLSQLYNDKVRGINSGYAKYETFPVWNLPLDHLSNIAYEMATVDIVDRNMIDPYYKKAYGHDAVNYNRDIEAFPILNDILTMINGKEVYKSPTEMGINMVGFAIADDKKVQEASFAEIERRRNKHQKAYENGTLSKKGNDRSIEVYTYAKALYEKLENE